MGNLYNKIHERTERIRNAVYTVIKMWECNWLPVYNQMSAQVNEPLKPQDAFFGGITNASKRKVTGKKLRYIDVVSLYPTVTYYDDYPVAHLVKFKTPKQYSSDWFDLVKCKVYAPTGLYHPVLPVKQGKVLFPLCVKHSEEKTSICNHTEQERAFIGTWTTEINKILEKGSKTLEVYDIWHFKERSNELFRGCIKGFMKIKLEMSPWQNAYTSKEEYAAAKKEGIGIELHLDSSKDNPGK